MGIRSLFFWDASTNRRAKARFLERDPKDLKRKKSKSVILRDATDNR